jgi:hypothetical protein
MTDQLEQVRKAVEAKRRAEEGYRAALVSAVQSLEDGGDKAPYAKVADVAGVSRQAVREIVKRHADDATSDERRMRERLALLDATYERAIDRMTDKPGYMKRVTAFQNARAKKLGRRGLAYPPVSVQMRDYAESLFLRALEEHADDPRWERIIADIDEAAALRKALEALDDSRMAF